MRLYSSVANSYQLIQQSAQAIYAGSVSRPLFMEASLGDVTLTFDNTTQTINLVYNYSYGLLAPYVGQSIVFVLRDQDNSFQLRYTTILAAQGAVNISYSQR